MPHPQPALSDGPNRLSRNLSIQKTSRTDRTDRTVFLHLSRLFFRVRYSTIYPKRQMKVSNSFARFVLPKYLTPSMIVILIPFMVLDCLFLDIYVPGKVLRDSSQAKKTPLPVIAWIHGGG